MTEQKQIFIEVHQIKGKCPVFKKGDRIVINGAHLDLENTDAVCIHALPSLLYYALALRENADPLVLGLSKQKEVAYLQCPDPGEPFTSGGTVTFRITRQLRRGEQ